MNLDEVLNRARAGVVGQDAELPSLGAIEARARRRRLRRRGQVVGVMGALVVTVIAVSAALAGRDVNEDNPPQLTDQVVATTIDDPGQTSATTVPGLADEVAAVWETIEVPPRIFPASVSTGDRVLVWGGEAGLEEGEVYDDGFSIDPETGTVEPLPDSPLAPLSGATAVWTGTEMVICCGRTDGASVAGYNPSTREWLAGPEPPVPVVVYRGSVWTGSEMVVLGEVQDAGQIRETTVQAYDPVARTWRELSPMPVAFDRNPAVAVTPTGLMVWPRAIDRVDAVPMLYDWDEDQWRGAPAAPFPLPEFPALTTVGFEQVAVGMAGNGEPVRLVAVAFDPFTETWRQLPDPAVPATDYAEWVPGSYSTVSWRDQLVLWTGAFGDSSDTGNPNGPTKMLSYSPSSESWTSLPDAPFSQSSPALVVTQQHLVVVSHRVATLRRTMAPPQVPIEVPRPDRIVERDGVRFEVPDGWIVSPVVLTPNLGDGGDPWESAAISNFDAPVGGQRCAHLPENALRETVGDRALVWFHRYPPGSGDDSALVTDLELPTASSEPNSSDLAECVGGELEFDHHTQWIELGDETFIVVIALGHGASDATRQHAQELIDSVGLATGDGTVELLGAPVEVDRTAGSSRLHVVSPDGDELTIELPPGMPGSAARQWPVVPAQDLVAVPGQMAAGENVMGGSFYVDDGVTGESYVVVLKHLADDRLAGWMACTLDSCDLDPRSSTTLPSGAVYRTWPTSVPSADGMNYRLDAATVSRSGWTAAIYTTDAEVGERFARALSWTLVDGFPVLDWDASVGFTPSPGARWLTIEVPTGSEYVASGLTIRIGPDCEMFGYEERGHEAPPWCSNGWGLDLLSPAIDPSLGESLVVTVR